MARFVLEKVFVGILYFEGLMYGHSSTIVKAIKNKKSERHYLAFTTLTSICFSDLAAVSSISLYSSTSGW